MHQRFTELKNYIYKIGIYEKGIAKKNHKQAKIVYIL